MSSNETTNAFQDVTIPDTEIVQDFVVKALDGFNQTAKIEVRSLTNELCNTVQKYVDQILAEGKTFHKLTHKSVIGSQRIANYCTDIISYVDTLAKEKVKGEDFYEALKELLVTAGECKDEATTLKKGYTQICHHLKEISAELQEYDKYLESNKVEHDRNMTDMGNGKKVAKRIKWTCILSSTGMTILAPVTGGISLIGTAIFAHVATKQDRKVNECRISRNESRAMLQRLNAIREPITGITTQTVYIIDIVNKFQEFWDKRVIEIKLLIVDFEKKKDSMVGYSQFMALPVIKKWTEVRNQYTSYSTNVLTSLNNTTTSRRIAVEN
nr:4573_t:CDS:1 [Entrophospora candida]